VITNRVVLALGGAYLLLKPTRYAILFWGPLYVNHKLGSDMTESAWVSGGFEIAGVFSVLLGGYCSDKVFGSKRMPVCVIALAVLGIGLLFFTQIPPNRWLLLLVYMFIGLLLYAPDSIISGTAAQDFGTRQGASTATGFVNGCGSVGAIVGGVIPGVMSDEGGSQWGLIFTLLGIMAIVGSLILLPMWNTKPMKTSKVEMA